MEDKEFRLLMKRAEEEMPQIDIRKEVLQSIRARTVRKLRLGLVPLGAVLLTLVILIGSMWLRTSQEQTPAVPAITDIQLLEQQFQAQFTPYQNPLPVKTNIRSDSQ